MIVKVNDIELNNEVLISAMKWSNNRSSIEKVLGESPKYIILDWRGVDISKIKGILPNLDEDICREYIQDTKQTINNIDVLFEFYKHLEYPDEIMLWDSLVDNHIISNDFYLLNTYKQNFDILMKFTDFYLPLEDKPKHTHTIIKYNGTLEELSENIGDLYYDSLSEFLQLLSKKLEKDSLKDRGRGRIKLANSLKEASENIKNSASNISDAWDICEPFIK
jgi:hypothetical protein